MAMENLADALNYEIERNKELLDMYRGIPTGGWGASMISMELAEAERAISDQDVVAMLKAYTKLKDNE